MSNHGAGTSYASLNGNGSYTLTNTTPTSANSSTTQVQNSSQSQYHNSYGGLETGAARRAGESATGHHSNTATNSAKSSAHITGKNSHTIPRGDVTGS